MKKLALIIGLAIFSIGAFAQVTIGLKGGYNTSLGFDKNFSYTGDNFNIQNDLSHGGHLGLFFRFGRRFYVQPEANYNLNIAKVNFTDKNNAIWTDNVLLSTVDVPVLLGFKIVNAKKFNLRIMAGPKFRFNAGSDKKIENVQDLTVVARKSQIGLDAGLGLDIWFLSFDVRYNLMQQLYHYKTLDQQEINMDPINEFTVSVGWKLIDIYKPKRY